MAIKINNIEIINNGSDLAIDVETGVGFSITSVLLWSMNDFKDYSLAKNLSFKLEQINNKEVFIVNAAEIQLSSFDDIFFIELETDQPSIECSTCLEPVLGITYNLSKYYTCLLNYFLKNNNDECKSCNKENDELSISISLTIDIIEKALEVGYYMQAIDLIKKLKTLCSIQKCTNCETVTCASCSKFKQY